MRGFREALWLPGWSDRSIWGYDEPMETFFAQLWRDCDPSDDPTVWFSGVDPINSGKHLAELIASVTDSPVRSIMRAMLCQPSETNDSWGNPV